MIPNEPATLQPPPQAGSDEVGQATFNTGVGSTFRGDLVTGVHAGVLADMKTVTGPNKFKPGEIRTQIVWLFQVVGREQEGELAYYTSFSTHEKSKLPGLCEALKRPLPTPENPKITRSAFIGARCNLFVKNEPGKQDPSKSFPRIKELLAA